MSSTSNGGAGSAAATATAQLQQRYAAALMPNYGVPPIALASGEGCRVTDADGKTYLDLVGGIAVSALGHGDPGLAGAVADQVRRIAHTSNLYVNEPAVALAERLIGLAGDDSARVFLANSGTEANEAALKLAKRAAGSERPVFVAAESGFHGRSSGALALTGKDAIRAPFGPFGTEVRFVPFGDAAALEKAVDASVAAVVLEPVQGEAGVVVPPEDYLVRAREACDAAGAALILDEIQSGVGRTGHWFAHQASGVRPDILTLAKGLGGGLPIGACIGFGRYAQAFAPGDHGSTFGGNPVAAAAANAVLDRIEHSGLLGSVSAVGAALADGIRTCGHPLISGVRGAGLWLGVELDSDAPDAAARVQAAAARHGFLVNAVGPATLRLAPPLILSAAEAREFTGALPAILDEVTA
ncbi:acetylornithine transaminase [Nocardiopsis coralliicola]